MDLLPQQVIGGVGLLPPRDVRGEARVPDGLLIALEEVPVPVGDGPPLPWKPMPAGRVEEPGGKLHAHQLRAAGLRAGLRKVLQVPGEAHLHVLPVEHQREGRAARGRLSVPRPAPVRAVAIGRHGRGRTGLAAGRPAVVDRPASADVGQRPAEPLGPEPRVGFREARLRPALPEHPERVLPEPVPLGPAEQRAQQLAFLSRIHVAPVLGDAPAVEPAAPAGGEVPGLLVERGGAVPVLEHTGLGAGRDALPEPLDTRGDQRGLDELARQPVQLLEEEALPGVGEDAVRIPEDPVDPAKVVAESRGSPPPGASASWSAARRCAS